MKGSAGAADSILSQIPLARIGLRWLFAVNFTHFGLPLLIVQNTKLT